MKTGTWIFAGLFILMNLSSNAQSVKYDKPRKPPVLRSSIGGYGGNISITRENAVAAVKLPLTVFEYKTNKPFTLSSYQVIYKQKTLSEDEDGKLKPSSVVTAQLFKSTPLPELWINEISTRLIPGEEIKFFDIIVKDEKGRVIYAPEINLSIK